MLKVAVSREKETVTELSIWRFWAVIISDSSCGTLGSHPLSSLYSREPDVYRVEGGDRSSTRIQVEVGISSWAIVSCPVVVIEDMDLDATPFPLERVCVAMQRSGSIHRKRTTCAGEDEGRSKSAVHMRPYVPYSMGLTYVITLYINRSRVSRSSVKRVAVDKPAQTTGFAVS